MLAEIGCLVLGVPVGYALRRQGWIIRLTDRVLTWSVRLLLFLLGLSLGADEVLMGQIGQLGFKGVMIGFWAVVGSLIGARLLDPLFERRKRAADRHSMEQNTGERGR